MYDERVRPATVVSYARSVLDHVRCAGTALPLSLSVQLPGLTMITHLQEGKLAEAFNGFQTADYTETDDSVEQRGRICLQIHGGPPSEAWYKEITIEPLTTKK